jgi:Transposase DDE domain
VDNHSADDEWQQTQANGISHPTHQRLPTLCGSGCVGGPTFQLVCSEPRKRPEGRRRYFACNDMRVTARQIMLGYRLRWAVELFHKSVKQNLGFEEVSTSGFDSVISHVHWVYCAYILLHMSPPGLSRQPQSLGNKQRQLRAYLEAKEKRRILQKLTQFGGVEKFKDEIRQALTDA